MPNPYPFPIDLVEPCPARAEGDRVPCHLFMPEVAWREPLPDVIRMRPRRDHWLLTPPPVRPSLSADPLALPGVERRVVLFIVGLWLSGASLLVAAHLNGWL